MKQSDLSPLLYEFLEVIYLFQKREEGLFGAVWQDIYLLKKLDDAGEMSIGAVSKCLRVPLFGASRIVSRLEEKGRVRKTQGKENKRVTNVGITRAGRKLLADVENYQFKLISRNIAVMKPAEIKSIASGLAKLRSLLDINERPYRKGKSS